MSSVRASRIALALMLSLVALPALVGVAAQDADRARAPFDVPVVTPGGDLPGEVAVQLVKVADGLIDPINVTSANDGSGRLFVVERIGRIRIIQNGELLPEPFLDITTIVERGTLEQGLLGLAFDPDFETNGWFYVSFTDWDRNGDLRVMRYTVSPDDPNRVDNDDDVHILTQDKPFRLHNAGELHFGPDGYLYVAIGDGGRAGNPYDAVPPSLDNLLGKILRIDVHAAEGDRPYAIPRDNPFTDYFLTPSSVRRETWAYGLRNPWQFSFDRRTGDLYVTDVGESEAEEINVQPAGSKGGANYGWNQVEGTFCWPEYRSSCDAVGVPPTAEYFHDADDCAIVGIGVYRGTAFPALDGIYFNADYCSGRVWGLARDPAGAWVFQDVLDTGLLVTGAGDDEAGELYVTSCTCSFDRSYDPFANPTGAVWRLVAADAVPAGAETAPPEPTAEATPDPIVVDPVAEGTDASGGEAPTEVTIRSYDIGFEPREVSVAAETDVRIVLPNDGVIDHTFRIDALGIRVELPPGTTTETTIRAPAGSYPFVCDVPGHEAAGMTGTLTAG